MDAEANKIRVLCFFSRILGNKTLSTRLVKAIDSIEGIAPTYLFLDDSDYAKYPAPWFLRFSCTLQTLYVSRKKIKSIIKDDFDILFLQSFELSATCFDLVEKIPTAIALDTTPGLSQWLIGNASTSKLRLIKSAILGYISTVIFRKFFSHINVFLPRTSWCADSLELKYLVDPDSIHVTLSPNDLSVWKPIKKKQKNKISLLFIGNDFKRKGGLFLLDLYQKHLSELCDLQIVSNDAYFKDKELPDGIKVVSGLTHKNISSLIAIYQNSDLFVFPTRSDQLGLVLTEACPTGLPIIATDIGGIKDLVKDNYNGYLMPYDDGLEEWAERIKYLIKNPDVLKTFGENSRKIAEEKLGMDRFVALVEDTIVSLSEMRSDK